MRSDVKKIMPHDYDYNYHGDDQENVLDEDVRFAYDATKHTKYDSHYIFTCCDK